MDFQAACSVYICFQGVNGYEYTEKNREGDHICYISDLRKLKTHYRDWDITKSLDDILLEICQAWSRRMTG